MAGKNFDFICYFFLTATNNVPLWRKDAGCWILDTGYWMLVAASAEREAGYWMLVTASAEREAGCWILVTASAEREADTGYWIMDTG